MGCIKPIDVKDIKVKQKHVKVFSILVWPWVLSMLLFKQNVKTTFLCFVIYIMEIQTGDLFRMYSISFLFTVGDEKPL